MAKINKMETEAGLNNEKVNQDKPFQCDVCLKCFAQMSTLKVHKRVHTKSHQCDICLQTFPHNSGLIDHKRTHDR